MTKELFRKWFIIEWRKSQDGVIEEYITYQLDMEKENIPQELEDEICLCVKYQFLEELGNILKDEDILKTKEINIKNKTIEETEDVIVKLWKDIKKEPLAQDELYEAEMLAKKIKAKRDKNDRR
jgi:hypothetical protein